jgi:hypothetical protein
VAEHPRHRLRRQILIYDAAGDPVGTVQTVNDSVGDTKHAAPQVVRLSDGSFVIVYDNNANDSVQMQRYSATGTAIGPR